MFSKLKRVIKIKQLMWKKWKTKTKRIFVNEDREIDVNKVHIKNMYTKFKAISFF